LHSEALMGRVSRCGRLPAVLKLFERECLDELAALPDYRADMGHHMDRY
jgi:hypothetical protein